MHVLSFIHLFSSFSLYIFDYTRPLRIYPTRLRCQWKTIEISFFFTGANNTHTKGYASSSPCS